MLSDAELTFPQRLIAPLLAFIGGASPSSFLCLEEPAAAHITLIYNTPRICVRTPTFYFIPYLVCICLLSVQEHFLTKFSCLYVIEYVGFILLFFETHFLDRLQKAFLGVYAGN